MNRFKKRLSIFLTVNILMSAFLSCGVDEYYYLPQVPQSYITRTLNTEAVVNLPSIDQYYYATNYIIFYRIYISDLDTSSEIQTSSERAGIHSSLVSDFNAFDPITDPTITSSITSTNTFPGRNYFRLELDGTDINNVLSKSGVTFTIRFPMGTGQWESPVVILNNGQEYSLSRSSELISPLPADMLFLNTSELSDYENANTNNNADVAGRSGISQHAYVSMYVLAAGYNNELFSAIYSKPTHISIFKLPNMN